MRGACEYANPPFPPPLQTERLRVDDARVEAVNSLFERAFVFMHKMPIIWVLYCTFLERQRLVTRTRRAFDRALQALPVTQHAQIWPHFVRFAKDCGSHSTCIRVFRRYLIFAPAERYDFVTYLVGLEMWDEAAAQLTALVDTLPFGAAASHTRWLELCDIVSRHPKDVRSVPVEAVLRTGIKRFSDQVGRLWCALAEHFVRLGVFEKARDVYEEAVSSLATVRDFAIVFDAYVQFEEALLTARLELKRDAEEVGGGAADAEEANADASLAGAVERAADLDDLSALRIDEADDVELRIARLELLMDRRPILLSSVMLRQNPHNVHEWHNRAKIFRASGLPAKVIATYDEAVRTVDPVKAVGRLPSLWGAYARFYEEHGDLDSARAVFRQVSEAAFRSADDLASVRCEWAEMELRHKEYKSALRVMVETTTEPAHEPRRIAGPVPLAPGERNASRAKLHLNARAWGLYLDLEESLGTIDSVQAAYARAFALKVATPAMVLNLASYCEDRGFFEESFRAYEQGVALFPWPHVREIWHAYLQKFVARYGGSKLERARDLFEQAVKGVPPADAAPLFLSYADLEERFGLVRHVMSIFDRAAQATDEASRFSVFLAYIRKAEEYFGAPRTREIYARAIEVLPEKHVIDMCLRFADLETKLGELVRARALFVHAANFSDPKKATAFWSRWQEWETTHGNEESFLDHLRLKRSLATQFATAYSGVTEILEAAGYDAKGKKAGDKRPRT